MAECRGDGRFAIEVFSLMSNGSLENLSLLQIVPKYLNKLELTNVSLIESLINSIVWSFNFVWDRPTNELTDHLICQLLAPLLN